MEMNHWRKKVERTAKRAACAVLSLVTAVFTPSVTAYAKPEWPADTGIESEAGIVVDMDSGAVLFGQNIHVAKAPASITKLLTALVVLENENTKMNDTVTFSHDAIYNIEAGSSNYFGFDEGDTLSVEDCLYAMILMSSNQAANALAEYAAGSRDAFAELMNEKVKEIGCGENTHFANPSGLNDESQYTTAYDMALISRAAFENEQLLKIASTKTYKIATKNNPEGISFGIEHKLVNTTNQDSEYYYPYAVAGKTGYTSIAGQTLVTLAEKDGRRLVCVTLKSNAFTHYKDSIALMNFGFDRFENLNIAENETVLRDGGETVDLGGVSYEIGDLTIEAGAAVTLPNGGVFTDAVREITAELPARHPDGAAARLVYRYDDRVVGSAYIISAKKALEEEKTASQGVDDAGAPDGSGLSDSGSGDQESGGKNGGNGNKTEGDGADGSGDKKPGFSLKLSGALRTVLILLAVAAVLIGAVAVFLKKRRDAERRRLEERKRRRMQRLKDIGCSEEEFNRMLEDRMNRGRRK